MAISTPPPARRRRRPFISDTERDARFRTAPRSMPFARSRRGRSNVAPHGCPLLAAIRWAAASRRRWLRPTCEENLAGSCGWLPVAPTARPPTARQHLPSLAPDAVRWAREIGRPPAGPRAILATLPAAGPARVAHGDHSFQVVEEGSRGQAHVYADPARDRQLRIFSS